MTGQTIILASDRQRDLAKQLVDRAPPMAVLSIKEATRTSEQNKLMQALLSDVARARPGGRILNTDQWKCLFMDALAKETNNASFTSRWEPGLDGDGVVNTGYRSSRLRKSEMVDLIEFIIAWGTQRGVEWSGLDARAA